MPDFLLNPRNEVRAAETLSADLATLVGELPDGVLLIDREWRIVYANAAGRRLSRLPKGELPSEDIWQMYPEIVGTEMERAYRQAMETGVATHLEAPYEPFDLWLDIRIQPVAMGVAVFYRDVTVQKKDALDREAAHRHLQEVFEASPEAIGCFDRQWNCTYINPVALRLAGGVSQIGKNLWKDYPNARNEPFYSHYWAAMVQRQLSEFEAYLPSIDGWSKISVRPFDEGIIIFSIDITAAKRAETARAAAAKELQQVFSVMSDGVVSLDKDWNYTFLNARAYELLPGRTDLAGKNFWTEFPEVRGTDFEMYFRRTMEKGAISEFESYYPAPLDRWFEIEARPSDGGMVVFFRDVTESHRAERVMREQQELLTVVQQTAHVASWEMDFETRALTFGHGSYPVYGHPLEKIDSIPAFYGVIPSQYHNLVKQKADEAATTMRPVSLEFEASSAAGESIWLEARAQAIAVNGVPRYLRGITFEITDRKRAEAEREAAARQLQQVFDVTSDAIFSLDRNWKLAYMNRRAGELMDRAAGALGSVFWRVYPELVGSEFQRQYERTMRTGEPGEFQSLSPVSNRWIAAETRATSEGIVVFFRDITQERKSAQVMQEQQELLSIVQQAAHVATFDIDLKTEALTHGPGSYEVYGRPFAEVSNLEAFRKLRLPRHHKAAADATTRALRTMKPVTLEFEVLGAAGEEIWLESRFQAVAVDGVARYLRGITIDITERKRNEATLVASESRYRALIELNPQALWMGDAEGNITFANQGFLDYLGLTMEAAEGQGWLEAFDPADHPMVVEQWTHSVKTGALYDVEARLRRAGDGTYRWWNLRAKPVRDVAGKVLYWLGVGNDLHDLKIQAEELRRQQVELESVYQTAPIGLALFDPVDFRYLRLNERQAQIVGLPKEEILGKTLTEIAPIEGLREMFEQVAEGQPIRNQLLEGVLATDPDAAHRYWTVNYFPVYGADGEVQAITAASLEITNQKRAEAALIQSEKLAAVGRLASSISHEINNPLEAVTNLLYLVNSTEELPPEVKTYVQMAQSELSRVSQIATQTLRFHRQAVSQTRVKASELVNAVLNLYQGRLTNSSIKVQARYDTETPILCFENDIRQVLNNLIANAIDAMRNGGRLVARAHEVHDAATGARGVRLTIGDTGHGMTPAVLARVYEPFYTTKDLNGTGLGLWISEGIVERHQGRLTVKSSTHPVHHGTVFTLFLPLEPKTP